MTLRTLERTEEDDERDSSPHVPGGSSSVIGASLNLSNSTIGAGCIGYGGAIAGSGGLLSVATMIAFAILSKLSFDLVIGLSLSTRSSHSSYEQLGSEAFGVSGRLAVLISKWLFSFGCMVAYIVIVRDNFASSLQGLGFNMTVFWMSDKFSAFLLSATVMLPLSYMRQVSPLEQFSALKIAIIVGISVILFYLYITLPPQSTQQSDHLLYRHWLQVHLSSYIQNLGTFVFTFATQHTIHIVYQSLRPDLRNLTQWRKVSTLSILLSSWVMVPIGLLAYITFWEETSSNLFSLYPPLPSVDIARLLLCVSMLLTYPLPFLSCRELIVSLIPKYGDDERSKNDPHEATSLVPDPLHEGGASSRLLPGSRTQLRDPYHGALTFLLWGVSVGLALSVPTLGDVLNLTGCISGTMIAFILPGLFAFRLDGYSNTALILLSVGGMVGIAGSYFSLLQLLHRG